jgi:hypothetical protein
VGKIIYGRVGWIFRPGLNLRSSIHQEYPKGLNKAVDFLIETRAEREAAPRVAMVRIEGGCYQMGSPSHEVGRDKDERQHRVCVEDFKMGKHEVTQAQWREVMGSSPSKNSGCDQCPVEQVSWDEVQAYLVALNRQTGGRYRLPTEARLGGYAVAQGGVMDAGETPALYCRCYNPVIGHTKQMGEARHASDRV